MAMGDEADSDDHSPKLPVMALLGVEAWGVAPDGAATQVVIQTATQRIAVEMNFETVVNLAMTLKAAMHQARKNAKASGGEDLVQAVPVNSYGVGHAAGIEGVLMAIDNNRPTETVYVLNEFMSLDLGRKLIGEGQRFAKRNAAIRAGAAIEKPAPRKLILPKGVH
jgi:hypothetical protein